MFQGKSYGTFLVRRSARNHQDDYVLSVSEIGKIANYIIHKEQDSYRIGDQFFTDVPQVQLNKINLFGSSKKIII